MSSPLKRYKFTYQTAFSADFDYYKLLYARSSRAAWIKFNNYCEDHNIKLHDAAQTLME